MSQLDDGGDGKSDDDEEGEDEDMMDEDEGAQDDEEYYVEDEEDGGKAEQADDDEESDEDASKHSDLSSNLGKRRAGPESSLVKKFQSPNARLSGNPSAAGSERKPVVRFSSAAIEEESEDSD